MITLKLALVLVAAAGWQSLPPAPITPEFNARTSVWTGKQMLVFGRDQQTALDSRGKPYATGAVNVAASYDPRSHTWRKLTPPAKTSGFMSLSSRAPIRWTVSGFSGACTETKSDSARSWSSGT